MKLLALPHHLARLERVALVACSLVPVLLVTAASIPALLVLPFLPQGVERSVRLVGELHKWTRTLLATTV